MSKLNIDQKSVRALFSDKKSDFLIPDYQRPYAWGEKECQTLWDDLFCSLSRKVIVINLIVRVMNIFWGRLLPLKMMMGRWKLSMDSSALLH